MEAIDKVGKNTDTSLCFMVYNGVV